MAYRRKSTSRSRTASVRKRRNAPARATRGRARVRRPSRGGAQTIRIVLETPNSSPVARPGAFTKTEKPSKAQF